MTIFDDFDDYPHDRPDMKTTTPIEKLLGMKCISCAHFSCSKFSDINSRLAYGRKNHGGADFGYCDAIDASDAVGGHLVIHERENPMCSFSSAGDVQ